MKNTSRFPWRRFHGVCSILIILYPGVSVTSPVPESAMTCNEGEFLCVGDKTCISAKWVCDNSPDCFDVSDEKDCEKEGAGAGAEPPPPPCEDDQFRCHSDRVCIDAAWVCDGGIDCNDKSDELNCTEAVICTDNEFRCKMTGHCIQTEYICDGTSDCIDNSDEDGCPEPTPANPTTAVSQSTATPDLDFLDLEKLNINPQKFSAVEFDFGENFALPENFTYHDTFNSEIPDKPLLITINSTDIILVNNVTLTNETTEITPVSDNFTRDQMTESIGIIDDLTNNTLDEIDLNSELSTDISFNLNDNSSSIFINETDDDRRFLEEFFETSTQDLSTIQTSDFVTISETSTMTSFGTFTETPITDTTITDTTITDTTIETIATTSPILDTTESTFPSTDTTFITTTIPTTTTTIPTTTTTTTTTTPTTTTQSTTTTTTTTTLSTTTTRRTTTPYPCAYNQFYCRADLNCIPVEWRCDHTEDCWDGSDEIHCDQVSVYCPYEDMINCQDTGQCIYLAWICDGHNDCDTGSDEFNCPSKD